MDAATRHRMLLLAGIEVRALPRMAGGNTINALTDWPKPPPAEPEDGQIFVDDDFIGEGDELKPTAAMLARHRSLVLLGVFEERAAPRYNPAPGRQVLTAEGAKKYQLPIGSTILPNGKILLPGGKIVTKATAKKHYLAGGGTPGKAASTAKYTPDVAKKAPGKKAAPKKAAPKKPAKKAAGKKAGGLKLDGVLAEPAEGAKFEILPSSERGKSGDGYAPGGQWGIYGASGILIRHTGGDEPRYLLVQRGQGVKHNKGLWQLPGGARDEKESPYQGAAREVHEEVGASEEFVGGLKPVGEHVYTHDETGWTYTTLAADSDVDFEPQVDGTETGDARWVTAAELAEMQANGELTPNTEKSIQPIIDSMPPAKTSPKKSAPAPAVDTAGAKVTQSMGTSQVEYKGWDLGYVKPGEGGQWVAWSEHSQKQIPAYTHDDAVQALVDEHELWVLHQTVSTGMMPSPPAKTTNPTVSAAGADAVEGVFKAHNTKPASSQESTPPQPPPGPPDQASIYVASDKLPSGATKVGPTIQAASGSTEKISHVKVPTKKGLYKASWDIYEGTTKIGTVHQTTYGGWEVEDPSGVLFKQYISNKGKAIAALVDRRKSGKGGVDPFAAQKAAQAQLAAQAQQKTAAKQAADAARAAARAAVDADLAHLRGRDPSPTPEVQAIYDGDFSALTRVGPQGGSNEGGIFEAPDGSRWYVKVQKSPEHAASEALAVDLYRAAGIDAPEVHIGSGTQGLSGGTHTATRILETVDSDLGSQVQGAGSGVASAARYVREAHEGFAVDAWLANWDVAGSSNDNIVTLDGKPVRIDSGGSLLYRAQGAPKGDQFGPVVTEWDRFADASKAAQDSPAGHAASLHSTISRDEILSSAARVEAITPDQIREMVATRGLPPSLADTLIARREDIMSRAAAEKAKPAKPFAEGAAASGSAITAAIPLKKSTLAAALESRGVPSADARAAADALTAYQDGAYTAINGHLYKDQPVDSTTHERIEGLDLAFDHSALESDIKVYIGTHSFHRLFGPGEWDSKGNMDGAEFVVPAYWSSTYQTSTAQSFAYGADPIMVTLVAPKGTPVIRVDGYGEAEILLQRGLRYRIVADHGVDADGVRRIDVEVVGEVDRQLADLSTSELTALLQVAGLPTTGGRAALLQRIYAAGIRVP